MQKKNFKIVILGGGAGGLSVAARLRKKMATDEIAIIEPAKEHYYQPLWTLVGAGILPREKTVRSQEGLIPRGIHHLKSPVKRVNPSQNQVEMMDQTIVTYEALVVATGLRVAWEKIDGLAGHLGTNGICSIYGYDQVDKAAHMIQNFRGGEAIFTMPPVPIKCAGAPQKIMYLADEIFRKNGVRQNSKIFFTTAGKTMFGVPVFAAALSQVVQRKSIIPLFQHRLVSVQPSEKIAVFEIGDVTSGTMKKEMSYDLLHVVPPMQAHTYLTESGLAAEEGDQKGWLAVDKFSLQHLKFPNIFGVGDVTGVPNSKTGAAIRKQAPVVVANILAALSGRPLPAQYDGYSSCPLVTGFGKVMLAEFGYDGKLMPTFPIDPTKERRSMWHLKKDLLPTLYWQGMLKGRA